jgi:D-apionolactonase
MTDPDVSRSDRVRRYGTDAPLPERRTLRAGPVTAQLEGGDLRYVTVGDREVVRRLYVGVRNRNWDTIEPCYTAFEVEDGGDRFAVRFTAVHQDGDVDFTWDGTIVGSADGTIEAAMDGVVGRDFLRNRIGFCVLHPMALAGTPVVVETTDGTSESAFPDLISPHQPFVDMVSISHPVGGETTARVTIRFEGDLFEDEDQRNWTDASYKTYCTPLRLPYPVEVKQGQEIRQRVTISVSGELPPDGAESGRADADVKIDARAVGTLPPIGFGAATHRGPLGQAAVAALRAVKPAHLWVEVDLSDPEWVDSLARATREARALETGLEVWVVADEEGGDGLARLAKGLGEVSERTTVQRVLVFPPVSRPIRFPRQDLTTTPEVLARAKAAFAEAGLTLPLGGGAQTYFTEFNRASDSMPLGEMAVAGFTINPQVHAFDNASLVETLAAQAETVRSARAIVGEVAVIVGPVSLKPRFNPNATGDVPEPGPDHLPDTVDPRQLSLFAAGWTLGSIRHLAESGAATLTYYETTGWRGLVERTDGLTRRSLFPSKPGGLFPLYHVFAVLVGFAGGDLLQVAVADPLTHEALALRSGERLLVLLGSFVDEARTVSLTVPALSDAAVRLLDESSYEAAAENAEFFLAGGEAVEARGGRVDLTLPPFGVACLVGGIAG